MSTHNSQQAQRAVMCPEPRRLANLWLAVRTRARTCVRALELEVPASFTAGVRLLNAAKGWLAEASPRARTRALHVLR